MHSASDRAQGAAGAGRMACLENHIWNCHGRDAPSGCAQQRTTDRAETTGPLNVKGALVIICCAEGHIDCLIYYKYVFSVHSELEFWRIMGEWLSQVRQTLWNIFVYLRNLHSIANRPDKLGYCLFLMIKPFLGAAYKLVPPPPPPPPPTHLPPPLPSSSD